MGPSSTGSQSCALDTVRNDRRRSRNENVARPTSLLPKLRSARCTLNGDTLNDAPREVDDLAVLDSWGAPAILQANHTHHGATTVWEEGSSSYAGDPDWELRIARHIELLDTGQLVPRWSVLVGSEKYAGSAKYIKEGGHATRPPSARSSKRQCLINS